MSTWEKSDRAEQLLLKVAERSKAHAIQGDESQRQRQRDSHDTDGGR